MTNWKEEFDTFTHLWKGREGERQFNADANPDVIEAFISTQFEKLISEIPDTVPGIYQADESAGVGNNTEVKQQLKAKWLGGNND